MGTTNISWTATENPDGTVTKGKVWNPTTGCTPVVRTHPGGKDSGCLHCYARTLHERFHGKGSFATITLHHDRLTDPLKWRKPCRVFVDSMSDLFHKDVPDAFIDRVFGVMKQAPHTFIILSKRADRMLDFVKARTLNGKCVDDNIWLGVSVENQRAADERIPLLLQTPAAVRFLSVEPMLEAVNIRPWLEPSGHIYSEVSAWGNQTVGDWPPLDWVICGGESGPQRRPFDLDWARALRNQCTTAGVPYFYKQGSSLYPGADATLDGEVWHQFPA